MSKQRSLALVLSAIVLATGLLLPNSARAADPSGDAKGDAKPAAKAAAPANPVHWQTSYDAAYVQAKSDKKLLFLYFQDGSPAVNPAASQPADQSAAPAADPVDTTIADPMMQNRFGEFVFARLPLNAQTQANDKPEILLENGAFSELRGGPGIVIIDLEHADAPYFADVISVCPMTAGKYYHFQPEHVAVLFDLPAGTLNQRTMIFAVRIHPEAPASTRGEADPVLHEEAQSHSLYQAQIGVQGHQQWESRFHRIISRLTGRGRARMMSPAPIEVVAESWPNQNLVDSCVDCVDSWRHSSGHWAAVNGEHDSYGYDIQRGTNGIWYATGIFSN